MKPPPPRFPASGSVTASAKPTATAASTALPPCFRIANPASLACRSAVATKPCRARTALRSAASGAAVTDTTTPMTKRAIVRRGSIMNDECERTMAVGAFPAPSRSLPV
jgi:hypothetical protein